MAPKCEDNDTGNLDTPKRSHSCFSRKTLTIYIYKIIKIKYISERQKNPKPKLPTPNTSFQDHPLEIHYDTLIFPMNIWMKTPIYCGQPQMHHYVLLVTFSYRLF
jgi:hypothetical protein